MSLSNICLVCLDSQCNVSNVSHVQLFRRVASSLPGMDQAEQKPRDSILDASLLLAHF